MKKTLSLVQEHNNWRKNCINLIASENTMSALADKVYFSDLMHRYAEGMPYKRYYQGLKYFDPIEDRTIKAFQEHFKVNFVDVRPISGTCANFATFAALTERGDSVMTLGIQGGSHVSHEKPGAVGILGLNISHLDFNKQEFGIDLEKARQKILEIRPKLLIIGCSAIIFPLPVKELKEICQETDTKIVYDAAHVFGLITAGFFQNPFEEGADLITSSTHKTFPGPQGGIILGNIDEETQKKIRKKVFPGVLSNHHLHRIPALHITLMEMKEFGKEYAGQIINNAQVLAQELDNLGFGVLAKNKGFTKSHQVLVDVSKNGGGDTVAKKLERANIILNKNVLPGAEEINVKTPKGIRIGVQEMTRYGMKESEMRQIALFIKEVIMDEKNPEDIGQKVVDFRKNFQEVKYCFK